MKPFVALVAALLALSACDSTDTKTDTEKVSVRIENASSVDFSSVIARLPGAEADYGALAAGQTSEYFGFERAYRYAAIEVRAGGETYALNPIDYVGEEPLAAGRYTYVLDVKGAEIRLNLERD